MIHPHATGVAGYPAMFLSNFLLSDILYDFCQVYLISDCFNDNKNLAEGHEITAKFCCFVNEGICNSDRKKSRYN